VRDKNKTKHLEIDKEDFLILQHSGDYRIFKAECTPKIEEKLKEAGTKLRIRIHATHSFTGFGKAKEQCFEYNENTNSFSRI